jgi:hypothetical protein
MSDKASERVRRTRGTSVVVDDGLNRARWAVVRRAWHRDGRLTRVTLGSDPTRWRVKADGYGTEWAPDGSQVVLARVLWVTR